MIILKRKVSIITIILPPLIVFEDKDQRVTGFIGSLEDLDFGRL